MTIDRLVALLPRFRYRVALLLAILVYLLVRS